MCRSFSNEQTEADYTEQIIAHFDVLYREAHTQGGRIMTLTLHPWNIGQPHRIKALEDALAHITGTTTWSATGVEILAALVVRRATRAPVRSTKTLLDPTHSGGHGRGRRRCLSGRRKDVGFREPKEFFSRRRTAEGSKFYIATFSS